MFTCLRLDFKIVIKTQIKWLYFNVNLWCMYISIYQVFVFLWASAYSYRRCETLKLTFKFQGLDLRFIGFIYYIICFRKRVNCEWNKKVNSTEHLICIHVRRRVTCYACLLTQPWSRIECVLHFFNSVICSLKLGNALCIFFFWVISIVEHKTKNLQYRHKIISPCDRSFMVWWWWCHHHSAIRTCIASCPLEVKYNFALT